MARLSKEEKDAEALRKVRDRYEMYASHESYLNWLERADKSFRYYNGNQWTKEERDGFLANGMTPVIVNKIKNKIKNVMGQEVRTRTKVRMLSRSGNDADTSTADAISKLAYFTQQKNNSTHKFTKISQTSRIGGIGWHELDIKDGRIVERVVDPFEIIPDLEDDTDDLSNQNIMFRHRWFTAPEAIVKFPDFEEYLTNLSEGACGTYSQSGVFDDHSRVLKRQVFKGQYHDLETKSILIVEAQERRIVDIWEVHLEGGGKTFVFSQKIAEDLQKNKKMIIKSKGYQVWSTFFTCDKLLYNKPLKQQLNPLEGWFLYTPLLYDREIDTGVPTGQVEDAIDAQTMYNKTQSKLKWLMASERVIYEHDSLQNPDSFRSNITHPQGLIAMKSGMLKNIRFEKHHQEISEHMQSLSIHDREIEDAMGIYAESLGIQTNASSGVAIQQRQSGTNNTQIMSLDRMRDMKIRYGRKLNELIRSEYSEEMVVDIVDDEGVLEKIHLNVAQLDKSGNPIKDEHGNVIKTNDVTIGLYDVFIEEVRDINSQIEEARALLFESMRDPFFQMMFQQNPEAALELVGMPDAAEWAKKLTMPPQGGDNSQGNSLQGGDSQVAPEGTAVQTASSQVGQQS